jgi:hypothetical protein
LALSAPAFAQSAGSPGAAPAGSGSNTPGSGVEQNAPRATTGASNRMGNGMSEGRAAAPNTPTGTHADPAPDTVRGDQNGQDTAK